MTGDRILRVPEVLSRTGRISRRFAQAEACPVFRAVSGERRFDTRGIARVRHIDDVDVAVES